MKKRGSMDTYRANLMHLDQYHHSIHDPLAPALFSDESDHMSHIGDSKIRHIHLWCNRALLHSIEYLNVNFLVSDRTILRVQKNDSTQVITNNYNYWYLCEKKIHSLIQRKSYVWSGSMNVRYVGKSTTKNVEIIS